MTEISIGEMFCRKRKELKISQRQLCEGICNPATLSRFEQGKLTLSNRRMRTMLQRMGLPDDRFYALLSKDEIELEAAEREARSASVALQRASMKDRPAAWQRFRKALGNLESLEPNDPFIRQCSLSLRATLGTEEGPYSFEERLAMQMEAIRLTVPRFDLTHAAYGPYSAEELRLIEQIAGTHSYGALFEKAVAISRAVLEYLDVHAYRLPQYSLLRTSAIYNCSSTLRRMECFQEALDMAESGWRGCVESGNYVSLAYFLWFQANCHHSLGNTTKCRELLYQAHYVLKATGDEYQLPLLDADAKKWCDITFPF